MPLGVWAGVIAGVLAGGPSTGWAVLRGRDPLEAALAAGKVLLPRESRPGVLLLAAVPVHFAISVGWAVVLARVLPRRDTVFWGVVAGGVIAVVDLSLPGRRVAAVRALPVLPQVADHLLYGGLVGLHLRLRPLRLC